MTDRDEIELPPEWLTVPAIQAWADAHARDAVIAAIDLHDKRTAELQDTLHDLKIELARCRKERDAARAEQTKPAKPKVHSRRLTLTADGAVWHYDFRGSKVAIAALCWTDDGRVWIESEKNRELAATLRREWGFSAAADALDGGVR